jgi:hypothetical protein
MSRTLGKHGGIQLGWGGGWWVAGEKIKQLTSYKRFYSFLLHHKEFIKLPILFFNSKILFSK